MDPKDEADNRVNAYLDLNKARLGMMSVDYLVTDVRIFVPGVSVLTDGDLRAVVAVWRAFNGTPLVLPVAAAPTPAENKIIAAIKDHVKVSTDGVDIKYPMGKVNIFVTGVTAELTKGDQRLAAGVSWGGTLSVEAKTGNFNLSGELSKEKWQIKLSYPDDNIIPDLGKLGEVFGKTTKGLQEIINATSTFKNLDDVSRIKDAVKPHMEPVKGGLEAVKGVAKATPKRVHVGLTLGSPDPLPGQTDMPKGVQAQLTLTLRF